MTRDCRCHRLFYPYFISSCSANSVSNLKTKTTISPVRKNCEPFPRWKVPKSNLIINHHSQAVSFRKRTFSHDSNEHEPGEFNCVDAFLKQGSQAICLDTNNIIIGSPHKANALRLQRHYSKRATSALTLSRVSSDSGTFPSDQTSFKTSRNSYESPHASCQEKENYDGFTNKCFHQVTLIEKEQDLRSLSPPTEGIQLIEDCEPLIFTMSPFTSPQPSSVFSTTDYSNHRNSLDDFNTMMTQKDDPGDNDDDEDERSISITSVLPIDIPQPHKLI